MAENGTGAPNGVSVGRVVAAAMFIGGLLLALVATAWTAARVAEIGAQPEPTLTAFLAAATLLLGGWAGFLLLWGASTLVRRIEDIYAALAAGVPTNVTRVDASANTAQLLERLVLLQHELREIALLSDTDRARRFELESQAATQQLQREVPVLLREHNWREARHRVQQARRRYPSVKAWDDLERLVEGARAQVESKDIDAARREIDELATIGAWDRAAVVVRDLQHRHPDSEAVAELVRRVRAGMDTAGAEERRRLMAQAQEATTQRRWAEALHFVEIVISRFPHSAEAHDLRLQVPTLRANLEIQTRQQLEVRFKALLKAQRHREALELARDVISRYPDSPQAAVLREQLPRIEELAAAR